MSDNYSLIIKNGSCYIEGKFQNTDIALSGNKIIKIGKIDLNKQPITYYAIGCWELSQDQGFEEESFFVDYITNLAEQLSVELKVEIRK